MWSTLQRLLSYYLILIWSGISASIRHRRFWDICRGNGICRSKKTSEAFAPAATGEQGKMKISGSCRGNGTGRSLLRLQQNKETCFGGQGRGGQHCGRTCMCNMCLFWRCSYRPVGREMMDSDSDFETSRRNSSRIGLETAIQRACLCIHHQRVAHKRGSVADEVQSRFPHLGTSSLFAQNRSKRVKLQQWKVIPVCLDGPHIDRVPTKGVLNDLCRRSLGSKWLTAEDRLEVNADATAEEFHFTLQCLFPPLRSIPYEFCKATGAGNVVLVPLLISNEGLRPKRNQPFHPFCSVRELKEGIGRMGKLYIRLLQLIVYQSCRPSTDHEVCHTL